MSIATALPEPASAARVFAVARFNFVNFVEAAR
jgi:hypothetical protein